MSVVLPAPHAAPRTSDAPLALGRRAAAEPGDDCGLLARHGLAQVESLMLELAGGDAGDPAAEAVRDHLSGGGKRLRARLALAAAAALGTHPDAAVGWAAACELLHNATLVHDDLQDGDVRRRGRPTTWVRFGEAQAITAGDLMLMLPILAIQRAHAPDARRWAMAASLARLASSAARGQAAERALDVRRDAGWEAYRSAAEGKTGALFQLPVEGAALQAGFRDPDARAVAEPFAGLGVLFQLQDDVLDLYGDKGRGRPGDDLREGKVSALVVEHVALHPRDADWLARLLAMPRAATPEADVDRAVHRFRVGGALAAVLERIRAEEAAVASAPALLAHPALRAVALELARVALAPIAHVGRGAEEVA